MPPPNVNLNSLSDHASAAVKRLNPDLFGVGPVAAPLPQPPPPPTLDRRSPQRKGRQKRLGPVHWTVTMVAHRHRLLDDDNNTGSLKPLRDAIAAWLGLDDADPRARWECGQVETRGAQGVVVSVQRKAPAETGAA